MPSGQSVIIGGGIQPGPTFALGHLVYVTNVNPAQVTTYGPRVTVDAGSGVEYTDVPNAAGVYTSSTNKQQTFRIFGGAIIEGSALGSVQIGENATATVINGIAIGAAANNSVAAGVTIGVAATNGGNAGVVIGASALLSSAAGVAIGAGASVTGNAGNSNGVAVGQGANTTTNAGTTSPIAIGLNATAVTDCVVIGSSASSNLNHALGVGSVVIGSGATSNKAQGFNVAIGYTATVTQTNAIAIGSGATVTAAAAQTYSIAIGAGTTITSTQSITIGGGGADLGANVLQLGAVNTPLLTLIFGAGNTIATPGAKTWRFTNASGTDNAAGNFTHTAPLSTGNALPASYIIQVGQQVAGSSATLQTAGNAVVFSHTTAGGHLATFGNAIANVSQTITSGTLASGANALVLTATMSSTNAMQNGVSITVTGAGSGGTSSRSAVLVTLAAGFTGGASTRAATFVNAVAGTGSDPIGGDVNNGVLCATTATTTGTNVGSRNSANGGNVNYGSFNLAITLKNAATNIGVAGFGLNTGTTPIQVGGFFGLMATLPTYVSAALLVDNGGTTDPVAIFRDNGTAVLTIADGGTITATSLAGTGTRNVVVDANGVMSAP